MDVEINRPIQPSQLYEVAGLRFRGISPSQILADKISAVSSPRIFRRIKDLVDLYYLSQVYDFDRDKLKQAIQSSGRVLDRFDGFLHSVPELKHAYDKFRFTGDVSKPSFSDVYATVKTYIKPLLPKERTLDWER